MWSGGSIRALSSSGPARPYIAVSKYHGDVGFSAARRLSGGNLELEPIRYTATFIAGLPRDFAVGQTLFAQSAELFEYLPARLPMCETGAPGMCGSVNNCVLRQDGPARGMSRRAHLFVDCRLPSEGSGSDETDRLPAGPAVRLLGRPAHKAARSRLTTSTEGWSRSHLAALSTLRSSSMSTTERRSRSIMRSHSLSHAANSVRLRRSPAKAALREDGTVARLRCVFQRSRPSIPI